MSIKIFIIVQSAGLLVATALCIFFAFRKGYASPVIYLQDKKNNGEIAFSDRRNILYQAYGSLVIPDDGKKLDTNA